MQIDYIRLTDGVTNNFVYTAPPEVCELVVLQHAYILQGTTVSYPMETIADSGTGKVVSTLLCHL